MASTLKMSWNGNIAGGGEVKAERFNVPISIPAQFGGAGDGADPKALLLSSAASCYLMTLVSILQGKKLRTVQLMMATEISDIKESDFEISHHVNVRLSADTTDEQAQVAISAIETADKACAIGNILKKAGGRIKVEGSVEISDISAS